MTLYCTGTTSLVGGAVRWGEANPISAYRHVVTSLCEVSSLLLSGITDTDVPSFEIVLDMLQDIDIPLSV